MFRYMNITNIKSKCPHKWNKTTLFRVNIIPTTILELKSHKFNNIVENKLPYYKKLL